MLERVSDVTRILAAAEQGDPHAADHSPGPGRATFFSGPFTGPSTLHKLFTIKQLSM